MKRYCFALDLFDDPEAISEYETHHKAVWPEILQSLRDSGIKSMQIYRVSNRLFMVMDACDDFDLAAKRETDSADPIVQEWEALMWKYQKALPTATPGEKWVQMQTVFNFTAD